MPGGKLGRGAFYLELRHAHLFRRLAIGGRRGGKRLQVLLRRTAQVGGGSVVLRL